MPGKKIAVFSGVAIVIVAVCIMFALMFSDDRENAEQKAEETSSAIVEDTSDDGNESELVSETSGIDEDTSENIEEDTENGDPANNVMAINSVISDEEDTVTEITESLTSNSDNSETISDNTESDNSETESSVSSGLTGLEEESGEEEEVDINDLLQ